MVNRKRRRKNSNKEMILMYKDLHSQCFSKEERNFIVQNLKAWRERWSKIVSEERVRKCNSPLSFLPLLWIGCSYGVF